MIDGMDRCRQLFGDFLVCHPAASRQAKRTFRRGVTEDTVTLNQRGQLGRPGGVVPDLVPIEKKKKIQAASRVVACSLGIIRLLVNEQAPSGTLRLNNIRSASSTSWLLCPP
jgi:hypothetical protein